MESLGTLTVTEATDGHLGDGVFDSDNTREFLGEVVDQIEAVIDEGLRIGKSTRRTVFRAALHKGGTLSLDSPVAPAVATLRSLLSERPEARLWISKEKVRRWMREYFEWFEREFVPANGPSKRYRGNVQREFNRLLRLVEGEAEEDEGD